MRNVKKIIGILTVSAMTAGLLGGFSVSAEGAYQSERLNSRSFGEAVSLGTPLEQSINLDGAVAQEDGKNMLYTTSSGTPATFNVVNLDDRKVERYFSLDKVDSSWSHLVDSKGNVYIAGCGSAAHIYRYSPETKEVADLGAVFSEKAVYNLSADEKDNIYFGTYPSGLMVKYDVAAKKYENLGEAYPGHQYCKALNYYNGKLYAGTNAVEAKLIEFDLSTKQRKEIPIPQVDGKTVKPESVYCSIVVDHYLFASITGKFETPGWTLLIYDLDKGAFVGTQTGLAQLYASHEVDGCVYYNANGYLQKFDLKTGKAEQTQMQASYSMRGVYGATLNGQKCLVTADYSGCPMVMNLETGIASKMEDVRTKGTGIGLQNIICDKETDRLYAGGYMASQGAEYDIVSGKYTRYFPMGQPEGMVISNGNLYSGIYPDGKIDRFDLSEEVVKDVNPRMLFKIGEEQQRPFAMKAYDGKILSGTIPEYNILGGALIITDEATGEHKTYRNVVKNQSVVGLTYKDGLIYGATSISGGLGIDPTEASAKMFVFDPAQEKVIREWVPEFPSDMPTPVRFIGDLEVGPDGLVWGACNGLLFAMNPETYELEKNLTVGPTKWGTGHQWRPVYLKFGSDGLLYTTQCSRINVIDTETMECIDLSSDMNNTTGTLALDSQDNIYYTSGTEIFRIANSMEPLTEAQLRGLYERIGDSLVLMIDNAYAIANGKTVMIDPQNPEVKAITVDDRTLLPVRFIAESLNAAVGWDEASQTVTLTLPDTKVVIVIGSDKMMVNDQEITLDVAAQTLNDRTLLPLRALAEALGQKVFWDDRGLIVINRDEAKLPQKGDTLPEELLKYLWFCTTTDIVKN